MYWSPGAKRYTRAVTPACGSPHPGIETRRTEVGVSPSAGWVTQLETSTTLLIAG